MNRSLTRCKVTLPEDVVPPLALIFAISFAGMSSPVGEIGFELGDDDYSDNDSDKLATNGSVAFDHTGLNLRVSKRSKNITKNRNYKYIPLIPHSLP